MHDATKLRKAISSAGINLSPRWNIKPPIFNHVRKSGTRRLKIWYDCSPLFDAPQKKQQEVLRNLKDAFGDRWLKGYFIEGSPWRKQGIPHFCIVLSY